MTSIFTRLAMIALFLTTAVQDAKATVGRDEVRRMVVQEAMRSDLVPPSLALAVAKAESDFQADVESHAGARGVMQIMPKTGLDVFGVKPRELWNPRLNIQLGISFLEDLLERYDGRWDLALSHYNGGSRVGTGRKARVIPATAGYVRKVLRLQRKYERDATVADLIAAIGDENPSLAFAMADQDRNTLPERYLMASAGYDDRRYPRSYLTAGKSKKWSYSEKDTREGPPDGLIEVRYSTNAKQRFEDEESFDVEWKPASSSTVKRWAKNKRRYKWTANLARADRYLDRALDLRSEYRGKGRLSPSERLMNGLDRTKSRFRRTLNRIEG